MNVVEVGEDRIDCPCGCGRPALDLKGRLEEGDGGAYFQAILMRSEDGAPHLWCSFATGPMIEGDARPCVFTVHAHVEEGHYAASLEDAEDSPVPTAMALEQGFHLVPRDVARSRPDLAATVFRMFDALVDRHSKIQDYVLSATTGPLDAPA